MITSSAPAAEAATMSSTTWSSVPVNGTRPAGRRWSANVTFPTTMSSIWLTSRPCAAAKSRTRPQARAVASNWLGPMTGSQPSARVASRSMVRPPAAPPVRQGRPHRLQLVTGPVGTQSCHHPAGTELVDRGQVLGQLKRGVSGHGQWIGRLPLLLGPRRAEVVLDGEPRRRHLAAGRRPPVGVVAVQASWKPLTEAGSARIPPARSRLNYGCHRVGGQRVCLRCTQRLDLRALSPAWTYTWTGQAAGCVTASWRR